jgi:hypothetical protein
MNRWGIWGLQVALCAALSTATATAADPSDDDSPPPKAVPPGHGSFLNTLDRWFSPAEKPPPRKPKPAPKKKPAEKTEPAPAKPPLLDQAAVEREGELQALLRRQQVCLKLMQIAVETHDEELQRKAEQLDERARAVYTQRTAHLPGCKDGAFESDEKTLEKHLGPADTASRSAERAFDARPGTTGPSQARNREDVP